MKKYSSIAFIPARSGSKRIPDKNIKILDGHPLIAYTIQAAISSKVFDSVICVTDSQNYAEIAQYYGAEVPLIRPSEISGDKSPDIEWVLWILEELKLQNKNFDIFSILRPTSPFRLPETIRRARDLFVNDKNADSLRAVRKCKEHPGKMWVLNDDRMLPLLPFNNGATPWHSSQYANLPEIYIQDASLEMAWTQKIYSSKSIAGNSIIPFVSQNFEGFDINNLEDWLLAQLHIKNRDTVLPKILIKPYKKK